MTIRKDLQRVKCFYNRKEDVTDNETSGYPSNSKFIQMQKKKGTKWQKKKNWWMTLPKTKQRT